MPIFSVSRESYVARANATYNIGSLFQVTATGSAAPTYVVLSGYDRNEYAGWETRNYGTVASPRSSYRSSEYDIVFTLRNGQYLTSVGDRLSDFTFRASSDENRLQNLNISAYNASGRQLEERNLQIVTRSTYTDATPGVATAAEIAAVARSYIGQVWDDCGCWNLASVISASAGASLCLNSAWIRPDVSANGQWSVAYNAAKGINSGWFSALRAGDVVSMAWGGDSGHIATVSRVEGGRVYVVDNGGSRLNAQQWQAFARADSEDLLVAESDFSTYLSGMNQSSIVVHRLTGSTPSPSPSPSPSPAPAVVDSDNSVATATSLGTFGSGAGAQTSVSSTVGGTDTVDYYRFQLSAASAVALRLTGLSADANLSLINSAGKVLATSAVTGTANEAVSAQVAAGIYYVRVNAASGAGNTSYGLALDQSALVAPTITARSTTLSGGGRVAASELFTVSGTATSFSFRDASKNGGSLLFNGKVVKEGTWITVSQADLGKVAFSVGNVDARDTIEVKAANGVVTSAVAAATVTSSQTDDNLMTARTLGAVGKKALTGINTVSETDRDDFWKFTMSAAGNVRVNLSGMVSDADLYVYNSAGALLGYSNQGGTASEGLAGTLAKGTYYAKVSYYSGGTTPYTLAVSNGSATGTAGVGRANGSSLAYRDAVGLGQAVSAGTILGLDQNPHKQTGLLAFGG